MKVTVRGRKFIERHEGLHLCPLKVGPFEKYWSVGYGHYGPDVKPGVCISLAQADAYLREDLHGSSVPAVEKALKGARNVKQCEIDGLASLAYNLGPAVLIDPGYATLARRLASDEGKRGYAARCRIYRQELPKWVKGGGVVLPGLVQRRKDEVRLCCRGHYGDHRRS